MTSSALKEQRPVNLPDIPPTLAPMNDIAQPRLQGNLRAPSTDDPTTHLSTQARPRDYGLIGECPPMRALHQMVSEVLHTPDCVLLTGETGTGKELVARIIHNNGTRRSKRFVVHNCASMPDTLLESELFGYRKSSFESVESDHTGIFDAANGGTLFLEDIDVISPSMQARLLRVLQEGEIRPLGGNKTHKVDVRVVASTHCDLRAQAERGLFRTDLFYRLASFSITLSPLRDRGDDVLILARHFASKACAFLDRPACRWTDSALEYLANYRFPDNVRELKGLVERAILRCEGDELLAEHFNLDVYTTRNLRLSLRERMDRFERNLLIDCLHKNSGNQTRAAGELGLSRRTLLYRIQRLKISQAELKITKKQKPEP
ncbi:MAG: sigma-54-dependent transcriptional regulator [Halopseudomonas sp.]